MLFDMRTLRLWFLCGLAGSAAFANDARPAVTASAGAGFLNRSFTWQGGTPGQLTEANSPFAGAVAVDAAWYPGAHVTEGVGSWFGLFGEGEFGLGLSSRLANSTAVFAQSATRLRFGGQVRFPLGERASLLVHGGYARQAFNTSANAAVGAAARPNSPDVLFDGPRAGLGVQARLGERWALEVLAGGQYVMGLGELGMAAWFPQATAFALDAGVGLSVQLVEHVRLRLTGKWQRTFLTLDRNTFRADSAAEQYISGALTFQWSM